MVTHGDKAYETAHFRLICSRAREEILQFYREERIPLPKDSLPFLVLHQPHQNCNEVLVELSEYINSSEYTSSHSSLQKLKECLNQTGNPNYTCVGGHNYGLSCRAHISRDISVCAQKIREKDDVRVLITFASALHISAFSSSAEQKEFLKMILRS